MTKVIDRATELRRVCWLIRCRLKEQEQGWLIVSRLKELALPIKAIKEEL